MRRWVAFLLMCCLLLSGCAAPDTYLTPPSGEGSVLLRSPTAGNPSDRPLQEPSDEFAAGQMGFSLKLFQQVAGKSKGKNMLISPLSVSPALAMTANGAAGKTADEMQKVLGASSMSQLNEDLSGYLGGLSADELKAANSIWIREGKEVQADFLQTNETYYDAAIYRAPFTDTTVRDINRWVDEKTDGMIPEILDRIGGDTVMYLINALAFDAKWKEEYHYTLPGTFKSYGGEAQKAEMLPSSENCYLEDANAQGILRDYKGGEYRFAALLPNEGVNVYDYVKGLTAEGLQGMLQAPKKGMAQVMLPKFSYEYEIKLNDSLKAMGMPTAFGGGADFSKMADGLFISEVRHKTFIELTEIGTRAGAVTSVAMNESAPMIERFITFDRPFVYMIIDAEYNLPVFMGIVTSL